MLILLIIKVSASSLLGPDSRNPGPDDRDDVS